MSGLRWAWTWEEFCEQVIGHPAGGFESIRRGAILLRPAGVAEPTQSEARAADLKRQRHRGPDRNVVVDELRRDGNKVTADALQHDGNKGVNNTFIDYTRGSTNTGDCTSMVGEVVSLSVSEFSDVGRLVNWQPQLVKHLTVYNR